MTDESPSAIEIRKGLDRVARTTRTLTEIVLLRYGLERLLYRLSQSPYRDQFVLKGAFRLATFSPSPHRATRDLDLLGTGAPDVERIAAIFRSLVTMDEDDGLVFDPERLRGHRIREESPYLGVRVEIPATLGKARLLLKIDVGFGDSVVPPPVEIEYPTLLDQPPPKIRAYQIETIIAEKFEAMVELDLDNSRMKDFYDLDHIARTIAVEGAVLCKAIAATFQRRGTPLPIADPVALTKDFIEHPVKRVQWNAYQRKSIDPTNHRSLDVVITTIRDFVMPISRVAASGDKVDLKWQPGGPWHSPASPERGPEVIS